MFAPPSALRNPIEDLDPVYLAMATAMAGEEAMRRRMQEQMDEAKEIGDTFRPKDPELPVDYRPPERHNYPTPVRLAND